MTKERKKAMKPAFAALIFVLGGSWGCGDKSGGRTAPDAAADADVHMDAEIDAEPPEPDCGIDATRIYDDVAALAAPQWEGRKPGTAGNQAAMDFVESVFTDIGLEPAGAGNTYRQPFAFSQWEPTGMPGLSLDATSLEYGTDFVIFVYTGSGTVSAEMVFVGHGMTVPPFNPAQYPGCTLDATGYDDYQGVDVAGKIAVVLRHGPEDDEAVHDNCPANAVCQAPPCLWNFGYKAANAMAHGAAGMVLVQDYYHTGEVEPNLTLTVEYFDSDFPALMVDRSRVEEVVPQLSVWADAINNTLVPASATTGATATLTVEAGITQVESENVIGAVTGNDPVLSSEVVFIGAHIDHLGVDPLTNDVYLGADDNGSGVAVVTELARMLTCSIEPARTVVFAAFNAEEAGLIGSCFYVDNPVFPLEDTVVMFSIDMVGAGNGTGIAVLGGTAGPLSWIVDVIHGAASDAELNYNVVGADPSDSSDHACFAYAYVDAVMIGTIGAHNFYHTPEDTIDTILREDLEAAALLTWAGLEPLAMGTEQAYLPFRIAGPGSGLFAPPRPRALDPWTRKR